MLKRYWPDARLAEERDVRAEAAVEVRGHLRPHALEPGVPVVLPHQVRKVLLVRALVRLALHLPARARGAQPESIGEGILHRKQPSLLWAQTLRLPLFYNRMPNLSIALSCSRRRAVRSAASRSSAPSSTLRASARATVRRAWHLVAVDAVHKEVVPAKGEDLVLRNQVQVFAERVFRREGGDDVHPGEVHRRVGEELGKNPGLTHIRVTDVEQVEPHAGEVLQKLGQKQRVGVGHDVAVALLEARVDLHKRAHLLQNPQQKRRM